MNRIDLQELRIHTTYPAITIIGPCNKIELTNQFNALAAAAGKKHPEIIAITEQTIKLLNNLHCPAHAKKIALFANKHFSRVYAIPCDIADIESIDNTFALDPIVTCINRFERYFVLDCTLAHIALYEGFDGMLFDVIHTKTGLGWKQAQPIGTLSNALCQHTEKSTTPCEYHHVNEFYKALDEHLAYYLENDPLPLIVYGDDESIGLFRQHSKHEKIICGYIKHLADAQKQAHRCHTTALTEAFDLIKKNASCVLKDGSSNHTEIVNAAREGRIQTLIVEKNFHEAGCENLETGTLEKRDQCSTAESNVDIIDSIIETVKQQNGSVLFAPEKTLMSYGSLIIAICRF